MKHLPVPGDIGGFKNVYGMLNICIIWLYQKGSPLKNFESIKLGSGKNVNWLNLFQLYGCVPLLHQNKLVQLVDSLTQINFMLLKYIPPPYIMMFSGKEKKYFCYGYHLLFSKMVEMLLVSSHFHSGTSSKRSIFVFI